MKRQLTFKGLDTVKYQKILLFITTAVKTSNPYWLFACSVYSYIQNMEAVRSSETSVYVYPTTWHHISEDSNVTYIPKWYLKFHTPSATFLR
jgi:hypothetical protein